MKAAVQPERQLVFSIWALLPATPLSGCAVEVLVLPKWSCCDISSVGVGKSGHQEKPFS